MSLKLRRRLARCQPRREVHPSLIGRQGAQGRRFGDHNRSFRLRKVDPLPLNRCARQSDNCQHCEGAATSRRVSEKPTHLTLKTPLSWRALERELNETNFRKCIGSPEVRRTWTRQQLIRNAPRLPPRLNEPHVAHPPRIRPRNLRRDRAPSDLIAFLRCNNGQELRDVLRAGFSSCSGRRRG